MGPCIPGQIHNRVSLRLSKGHVCPKSDVSTASWILFQKKPNLPVGPTPTEVWVSPPGGSTPHRHRPAPRGAQAQVARWSGSKVYQSDHTGSWSHWSVLRRAVQPCLGLCAGRSGHHDRVWVCRDVSLEGSLRVRPEPSVPDHSAYSHTQPPHTQPPHTPLIYILAVGRRINKQSQWFTNLPMHALALV